MKAPGKNGQGDTPPRRVHSPKPADAVYEAKCRIRSWIPRESARAWQVC